MARVLGGGGLERRRVGTKGWQSGEDGVAKDMLGAEWPVEEKRWKLVEGYGEPGGAGAGLASLEEAAETRGRLFLLRSRGKLWENCGLL